MKNHNPVYIHYGATKFDPTKGFPIKNDQKFTKPLGGLWASRIDATYGWKQWCKDEDFREIREDESFIFTIKSNANVITISSMDQLDALPSCDQNPVCGWYYIDFEKCLKTGIDAIKLCWYGDEYDNIAEDDLYHALYGWDCDCVLILNPDVVVPL